MLTSYTWIKETLLQRLLPCIAALYHLSLELITFRDLFFVHYSTLPGAQNSLGLHRDGSLISFNILLNPATDFEGGGTFVAVYDRVISLQQGEALLHSGQLLHAGNLLRVLL